MKHLHAVDASMKTLGGKNGRNKQQAINGIGYPREEAEKETDRGNKDIGNMKISNLKPSQ